MPCNSTQSCDTPDIDSSATKTLIEAGSLYQQAKPGQREGSGDARQYRLPPSKLAATEIAGGESQIDCNGGGPFDHLSRIKLGPRASHQPDLAFVPQDTAEADDNSGPAPPT